MEQIGEYFIHRLIGEGGMGKVYEAEERLSRRRVALKVLRDDLARSEDGRRLFLREMAILSHLDHANVVRCLACTEVGEHLVMVLEHMSGQTLREVLRQRARLPWADALRITADVAAGLAAAHGHQPPIIHRDLKPENVMVLADGRSKVMDFGIAKILDAAGSQTVFTVGTLQYMSPEQIEGFPLDPRADLYCLGLLLYEMLTGRPPFASESPRELLNLHCTQAPSRLPSELTQTFPSGLEAFVLSLLEKNRDRRPPNADAVQRTIAQLQHGGATGVPTGTPTPGPSLAPAGSTGTIMLIERAGAAQRRGHLLGVTLAIIGAVLLVGGGVTAMLVMSSDREPAPANSGANATPSAPVQDKDKDKDKDTPAAAATTPAPEASALEARAEAVRQKALADRKAAEAERARSNVPVVGDENPPDENDEGLVSGVFSRFGVGKAKPDDTKPDDTKPDDAEPDDGESLLDIFRNNQAASGK